MMREVVDVMAESGLRTMCLAYREILAGGELETFGNKSNCESNFDDVVV